MLMEVAAGRVDLRKIEGTSHVWSEPHTSGAAAGCSTPLVLSPFAKTVGHWFLFLN